MVGRGGASLALEGEGVQGRYHWDGGLTRGGGWGGGEGGQWREEGERQGRGQEGGSGGLAGVRKRRPKQAAWAVAL